MSTLMLLFVVPALSIVVLSMLLLTIKWSARPLGVGLLAVFGVLFGGPSAIVMLGAQAGDSAHDVDLRATTSPKVEAVETVEGSASTSSGEANLNTPISDSTEAADESVSTPENVSGRGANELPDWVLAGSVLEGNVHRVVVESGPHQRIRERDLELDKALLIATNDYIAWYLESDTAPMLINFDLQYIKSRLVSSEHKLNTVREFKVGPMHTSYAMLEVDHSVRQQLDHRWQDVVAKSRMLYTALIGGAVLALLGVMFSYFCLDNATRGFYTGRLQFVAVAVILILVAAGVLTARWIPWM